jgi:hypothetical protein
LIDGVLVGKSLFALTDSETSFLNSVCKCLTATFTGSSKLPFCGLSNFGLLLFSITQDSLLFALETPKFVPWAVLGEGCSSARDPDKDPGALICFVADFARLIPACAEIVEADLSGRDAARNRVNCDFTPSCRIP